MVKHKALAAVARRRTLSASQGFRTWLGRYGELSRPLRSGHAVRADYRDALGRLPANTVAVYADPPYTRDHYSRFYHVLETLALGDEPRLSTVTIGGTTSTSRGLYRAERHQSPFCIKSEAPSAFQAMFARVAARGIPLVLSYSPYDAGAGAHPRLLPMESVVQLAERSFSRVDVRSPGEIAHSKFNAAHLNNEINREAELLVVCRP